MEQLTERKLSGGWPLKLHCPCWLRRILDQGEDFTESRGQSACFPQVDKMVINLATRSTKDLGLSQQIGEPPTWFTFRFPLNQPEMGTKPHDDTLLTQATAVQTDGSRPPLLTQSLPEFLHFSHLWLDHYSRSTYCPSNQSPLLLRWPHRERLKRFL